MNLVALSRCGFETDFKCELVAALSQDSPLLRYQDALARAYGLLVEKMVAERAGSMILHSDYPHKLAGLLSEKVALSRKTMSDFELDVKAFWEAREVTRAMFNH